MVLLLAGVRFLPSNTRKGPLTTYHYSLFLIITKLNQTPKMSMYAPMLVHPANRFDREPGTVVNPGSHFVDANHPLTTIMGPPRLHQPVLAESRRYETRYQYPKATENEIINLAPVIIGLTTDPSQDQSFLLRILPPVIADASEIHWNVFEFAEGIAQTLSEESVPHTLKFAQREDFATIERRGIAIRGEANFLYTPMGQALIRKQVIQMARACRESQDVDSIFTIMNTDGPDYGDQFKRGMFNYDWDVLLSMKNAETFCLQKRPDNADQLAFMKLVDSRKQLLISRGAGSPSNLIICRGTEVYLHGMGQDNSYAVAGPEGPQRAKQDMFAPVSSYRGMEVNYLKQYVLQRDRAPSDFFHSPCIGGEFYYLPAGADANDKLSVYDFNTRRFKAFTRRKLWNEGIKLAAQLNVGQLANLITIPPAANVGNYHLAVMRAFFQTNAGHAVMLRGGPQLGHNYIGSNSNFEWGDNASDQTKLGTFAFYSKAVIFDKLHVTHLKNIVSKEYIGGGGTNFFTGADLKAIAQTNWTPFLTKRDASMFVMLFDKTKDVPQHLPLSGKFMNDTYQEEDRFTTLPNFQKLLGLNLPVSRHTLQTFYDPNLMSVSNNGLKSPLVVSMGYHRIEMAPPVAGAGRRWSHVLGDSFLGNDIYPGCEKVLDGIVPCFTRMYYERNPPLSEFYPEVVDWVVPVAGGADEIPAGVPADSFL